MKKKTMPRAFALLLAVALVCSSIIAVPSTDAQAAAQMKLSSKKQTLYVGGKKGSFKLKATGKAAKKVTFKSSKPSVASVKAKGAVGTVTAKSAGTATITVTSKSNKKAKATCKITVKEGIKSIQTASKLVMQKGKSVKLNLGFTPSNAANAKAKEMAFATSKKSVATVDKNGKIKAKKAGSAKITVEPKDKSAKKVTIKVTVKNKITPVKKITLNKTEMALNVGAIEKLTTTLTPKKPTSKNLYWVSDNTNVATVKNGAVTAVSNGTAKITAYATDNSGKKATCTVTVTTAATGIALDQATMTFTEGEAAKVLTATLAPETVSDPTVIWTVDNPAVAKVTSPGLQTTVTPVAAGTATVTATTSNGLTAACVVTVNPAAPVISETEATQIDENGNMTITLDKSATGYRVERTGKDPVSVAAATVASDYAKLLEELQKDIWSYSGNENFFKAKWDKFADKLNEFGTTGTAGLAGKFTVEKTSDTVITVKAGQRTFVITRKDNDNASCDLTITNNNQSIVLKNVKTNKENGTVKVTAFIARADHDTALTVELKEGEMKAYLYGDADNAAGELVKFTDTDSAYVVKINGTQYLNMKNEFGFSLELKDIKVWNVK